MTRMRRTKACLDSHRLVFSFAERVAWFTYDLMGRVLLLRAMAIVKFVSLLFRVATLSLRG